MDDPSADLQQLALQAVEAAVESFAGGDPNPFVFFVDESGQSHTVAVRIAGDADGSEIVEAARNLVSQGIGEAAYLYALAYDGYLTTDGERFDAVFIEAGERGQSEAVLIAQRYRMKKRSKRVELIGRPTIIDSVDMLLS
jgi:hypothetical protein